MSGKGMMDFFKTPLGMVLGAVVTGALITLIATGTVKVSELTGKEVETVKPRSSRDAGADPGISEGRLRRIIREEVENAAEKERLANERRVQILEERLDKMTARVDQLFLLARGTSGRGAPAAAVAGP